MTFGEQASLKDLAFLMTLLRVFLQAGFDAQGGDIGQAISMVRRSSSIQEENDPKMQKGASEQFSKLMNSAEGQEIMLDTNFEQLFDRVMQLLVTACSKQSLIYEDKLIIENALSIMTGTLLYKPELYPKFESFTSQAEVKSAEQLVLTGLLS